MKAVLVIDVPETCMDCPFIFSSVCDVDDAKEKDKKCPLRPLPKVKTREEEIAKDPLNEDLFYDDYIRGYNDCLKEITGETE